MRVFTMVQYQAAKYLNGYKITRNDIYIDVVNLLEYANEEFKKEESERNMQNNSIG